MTIQCPVPEATHRPVTVLHPATQRHVALGYIVGTVSAYSLSVMVAIDKDGIEAITRIRLTGVIQFDDVQDKHVREEFWDPGVIAPVSFEVPRTLWCNLPGGRTPVRVRIRADLLVRNDGPVIRGALLHLFPTEGCRLL
jgi:hypothetical protein